MRDKDKSKTQAIAEEIATEIASDLLKEGFRFFDGLLFGQARERERKLIEKVRAAQPTEEFYFADQVDEEIEA